MSLINDALKKAQKQRTGETPLAAMPGVGGESAARIAKRAKPTGFNSLLLRLGLGAGVVLVLGVGGYFAFRGKPAAKPSVISDQPPAAVPPAPVAQSPAGAAATPPQSVPSAQPSTLNPQPSTSAGFTLPTVIPPPPTPEPVASKPSPSSVLRPPSSAPTPSSVVRPPSSEVAKPAAPAKLEPRAITFIEGLKIAGIRASATDSKVLMSDRVYRVGDMVEHEMGLKLIGITANSLTFEDERGGRYTRQF